MPRKSSSHLVAHVVTAFVDRLTEAIHELAATRAHSEVLAALGGARKRGKPGRRSRVLGARTRRAKAEPSEKTAKKTTRKAASRRPSKKSKKAGKTLTPATKTATKTATKAASAKSMVKAATRTRASEKRVKGKGTKPRPRPTGGALQAQATKKSESISAAAQTSKVTPVASTAPGSGGAPTVSPSAVLSPEPPSAAVS